MTLAAAALPEPIVASVGLMVFAAVMLSLLQPIARKGFGERGVCALPGLMLALELGQLMVLLEMRVTEPEFWGARSRARALSASPHPRA